MKFTVHRTSHKEIDYPGVKKVHPDNEWCRTYEIEINTLEDLQKLEEAVEDHLIISMRYKTIEIYDSYRE